MKPENTFSSDDRQKSLQKSVTYVSWLRSACTSCRDRVVLSVSIKQNILPIKAANKSSALKEGEMKGGAA